MKLNQIFQKPVDRQIEGVIKADDETSLKLEIEEYVLTNEVSKRLEDFLDAYNDFQNTNGAWLSGFFGSGKSHLLKMMACLLENKEVNGISVKEAFLNKCGDDKILQAKIEKALQTPSKSILFNIDQKADIISKDQIDALLSVFSKVFDEMCGYYGKQGYIAQFERDLDSRGLFDKFKNAYEEFAGKAWEKGRQQALLEDQNIAKAYAKASGSDASEAAGILKKYRKDYKLSIEDFAEQINNYINKQSDVFRLNFFVDEVGQYIADNVKLMTNLQTIAESLATKCKGRAWIVVTAQEDINAIVGDMTKQQGNDFSKIQARFNNRLKLTSADVSEVIQRRLLTKVTESESVLSQLYKAQVNNFKTLFDFADGAKRYRNFKDEDHFISSYPFIPYQFDLFQACIQHLSIHNAFEGKHSSVGERSMLGVFQQVAKQILDHEIGQLATFDLMFEGLRTALKAQIQSAIIVAERNLENKFAIKLLKALFLVKYVKDFNSTVRNLCVLMYDSFDRDLPTLKKDIERALAELEQQTYIQRNGETYEFLTNEEKDIEEEIKHTEIDTTALSEELSKIIFDSIIGFRKIRYDGNGHDYPFAKKLDDKLVGREQELAIHVVTPFHDSYEKEDVVIAQSLGRVELLVILPNDDRLVKDLMTFQRTNKYIRQNTSSVQQESVSKILRDKGDQNHKRASDIEDRLKKMLSESKMFVLGETIDVSSKDPRTRINEGFAALIKKIYPQLQMLKGTNYTEAHIAECLTPSNLTMFGDDMIESEQEMLASIKRSGLKGVRMTIKSLVVDFQTKPYGWYYEAVLCTLAKLCTRGKVELRQDGNLLEDADLERAITNNHLHQNVIIESQADFSTSQVRQLKDFYKDFFDKQPNGQEAKALGKEASEEFKNLYNVLNTLAAQSQLYLFLDTLKEPLNLIATVSKKQYSYFLTNLSEIEGKLMDYKDDIIAPIRSFMGGSQRVIYDEIRTFLQDQVANFDYVDGSDVKELKAILSDLRCYSGGRIKKAKELADNLKNKISEHVNIEQERIRACVEELRSKITSNEDYKSLNVTEKNEIDETFGQFISNIKDIKLIARIRDSLNQFENGKYKEILIKISKKDSPKGDDYKTTDSKSGSSANDRIISAKQIRVHFSKPLIKNQTDIDEYIASFKEALIKEIREGRHIQV